MDIMMIKTLNCQLNTLLKQDRSTKVIIILRLFSYSQLQKFD